MANWKTLNDRERRAAAIKEIAGEDLSPQAVIALDHAEAVTEASLFMRQMREQARLTQAQLGERLGVTQARISELERGNAPEGMSYALLRRAAKACGFRDWPMAPVERRADAREEEREPTMIEVVEFAHLEPRRKPLSFFQGLKRTSAVHPGGNAAQEPAFRIVVVPAVEGVHLEAVDISDTVKSVSDVLSNSPAFKVLESK